MNDALQEGGKMPKWLHSVCERGQVVEHKRDLKFKHFSTETRFDIADMN